jgi:hypothetical protein
MHAEMYKNEKKFLIQNLTLSPQSWEDGLHGNLFQLASALLFDENSTKSGPQAVLSTLFLSLWLRSSVIQSVHIMDQRTIKTRDPNCRLYWCLTEFID